MSMTLGKLVCDRVRTRPKFGIIVGLSARGGKLRVRYWRDADDHWGPAVAVAEAQLAPVEDLTTLPLTQAKRLTVTIFEREYLARLMERSHGSVSEGARAAGIDRANFRRLLQRHDLRPRNPAKSRRKKARA